ncbi:hypothetical protein [Hyphomonas oceanitis]|uniref:hypothetical protein n=1 Tax=Hyphomonas oceanitis TaxID=81033 RepID=UPI003002CD41
MLDPYFEPAPLIWDHVSWFRSSRTYEKFQALKTQLPDDTRNLAESDRDRILDCLIRSWRSIFEGDNSPSRRKEISKRSKKVRRLALELFAELDFDSPPGFEARLSNDWAAADLIIRNDFVLSSSAMSEQEFYQADFDVFKRQVLALVAGVDLLHSRDGMKFEAHAPKDPRRNQIAEVMADVWITIGLLNHKTLQQSLPTGSNGGVNWCHDMFSSLCEAHRPLSGKQIGPTSPYAGLHPDSKEYSQLALERFRKSREWAGGANIEDDDQFCLDELEIKRWSPESLSKAITEYLTSVRCGSYEGFPLGPSDWEKVNLNSELAFEFIQCGANLNFKEDVLYLHFSSHSLPLFDELFSRK